MQNETGKPSGQCGSELSRIKSVHPASSPLSCGFCEATLRGADGFFLLHPHGAAKQYYSAVVQCSAVQSIAVQCSAVQCSAV